MRLPEKKGSILAYLRQGLSPLRLRDITVFAILARSLNFYEDEGE
jgi:hypothetical protein